MVVRQPETLAEAQGAFRAMLACPTGSIGVEGGGMVPDVFPYELENGVFEAGFTSRKSFGANAFFVVRGRGNLLVDSPRFMPRLVHAFEARGGLSDVLLTHKDDVADAERYAQHFSARVWVHEHDAEAAPFATNRMAGTESTAVRDDVLAIPVPGHTRGSVAYLLDGDYLFTGDSLHWSRTLQDLCAFRDPCWHSWHEQIASLERLAQHRFRWVLAGHGDRRGTTHDDMHARLLGLVERLKANDPAVLGRESGSVW